MKRFLPGLIAVVSLVVLTLAGTASFPWGH
jgi:hypothetical protein